MAPLQPAEVPPLARGGSRDSFFLYRESHTPSHATREKLPRCPYSLYARSEGYPVTKDYAICSLSFLSKEWRHLTFENDHEKKKSTEYTIPWKPLTCILYPSYASSIRQQSLVSELQKRPFPNADARKHRGRISANS